MNCKVYISMVHGLDVNVSMTSPFRLSVKKFVGVVKLKENDVFVHKLRCGGQC